MKRFLAILVLCAASGASAADCTFPESPNTLFCWKKPVAYEIGLQAAAIGSLWIDVAYSLDIKNHPGRWETNPLLGKHPSDLRYILQVGAIPTVLLTGVWYILPSHWRNVVPVLTMAVEIPIGLIHNHQVGLRIHF